MSITLYDHQKKAIEELESGSILCGGVGSGKSLTAIAYYYFRECKGSTKINDKGLYSPMKNPMDLYIITTAKKRDSLEWEGECSHFAISTKRDCSIGNVKLTVDSWNNISKYVGVQNAFFIFDEQRVVGSGTWVKSFLKIVKTNKWLLLSATPGDVWTDYIPVFVANKFYKNRTQFLRRHAIYSRFTKYPKIDRFIETDHLEQLRDKITVIMEFTRNTIAHDETIIVPFDKELLRTVIDKRWDVFKNKPVKNVSELFYLMRKVVNKDQSRLDAIEKIISKHPKIIIFYNFDYELELLRDLGKKLGLLTKEWNGHFHEPVPKGKSWLYLVQYSAGAEGWNCIETNTIVFFSQNYSYKIMVQAAGRIDRLNTPFRDLYYYHIRSNSIIDIAIKNALKKKRNFNIHVDAKILFKDTI